MYRYHKSIFNNFIQETAKSYALSTVFLALVKSGIALTLIVMIHNSIYSSSIQLVLYLVVFMLFSIFQSAYSLGGFLTRNKSLYYYSKSFFKSGTRRFDQLFEWFNERYQTHSTTLMKLVVIVLFTIVFLPNFSILLTSNILFSVSIIVLMGVSLFINHIIYFGLTGLLVLQYHPYIYSFEPIPVFLIVLTFIILFVGFSIDYRLQQKMFFVVTMMPVKRFNFKLGYDKVTETKHAIIYQNIINKYYYVYFRRIGLVVVYYSELDLKVSKIVQHKMVQYGKKYIHQTAEI
jgi:hypothetical protein